MDLVTMICVNDKKVLVDINELRNSPRLQDAHIFKRLMCIEQSEFKTESLNTNLFKDFNIHEKDWCCFINFIRNGRIEYDIAANNIINIEQRLSYQKLFMQELDEQCNSGIFCKFGPIPVFDQYVIENLNTQQNKINEKVNINLSNPMTPEQDVEKNYIWTVGHANNLDNYFNNGWSVTINTESSTNMHFYLRRPVQS